MASKCLAQLSHLSTEYVHVGVQSSDGLNPNDIFADLAFTAKGVYPVSGDWKDALVTGSPGRLVLKVLVGPTGAVTLAPGPYDVWVRIDDTPEDLVREAGTILIT